jgi:hypothetical protein
MVAIGTCHRREVGGLESIFILSYQWYCYCWICKVFVFKYIMLIVTVVFPYCQMDLHCQSDAW